MQRCGECEFFSVPFEYGNERMPVLKNEMEFFFYKRHEQSYFSATIFNVLQIIQQRISQCLHPYRWQEEGRSMSLNVFFFFSRSLLIYKRIMYFITLFLHYESYQESSSAPHSRASVAIRSMK